MIYELKTEGTRLHFWIRDNKGDLIIDYLVNVKDAKAPWTLRKLAEGFRVIAESMEEDAEKDDAT